MFNVSVQGGAQVQLAPPLTKATAPFICAIKTELKRAIALCYP
ncbi:hypothetical protein [Nostoc sp. CHAB 5836]|nr:hypothetical protein [Nostoc sp. CHAB 5836]